MDERRKTKWEAKREATRAALVDSAIRCFHERGYAATTVADIVKGTGHTSGAFYFHFADKAECFWAAIERRERMRGEWWESVTAGLTPESASLERVLGRAFAHFDEALGGLNDWVLAMVDFHQQHRGDPEVAERLARVHERWQAELRTFVSLLAERGWMPADRDPAVVSTQIFAFAEGLTVHTRLYGLDDGMVRAALIDGLVRLLR